MDADWFPLSKPAPYGTMRSVAFPTDADVSVGASMRCNEGPKATMTLLTLGTSRFEVR